MLGVVEKNNRFFFDGLTEETIIRYKKNFWDCAHNKGKVSICLPRESDVRIERIEESYILICDIPARATSFALFISAPIRSGTLTGGTTREITCVTIRR